MARGLAAAFVIGITMGCDDVPLLPKWDADWYVPLPSSAIRLNATFPPVPIPPGTSATVADTLPQGLDDSVGDLFDRTIRTASLIVTLTKPASLRFSASDTVNVSNTLAGLSNAASDRIQLALAFAAGDTAVTDTVAMSAASILMIQQTAANGGTLHVEIRGRVTYAGPGNYTVQPGDSIGVRLAILARIPVSQ